MNSGMKRVGKDLPMAGYQTITNARPILLNLYQKTLHALAELPKESQYRKYTERTTQFRLNSVQKDENTEAFEATIGCGFAEELIKQAECELDLIAKMKEQKVWEPLEQDPPHNQWKWP
eukprot:Clim_evm91s225 gene=Clim_evmTU91s225